MLKAGHPATAPSSTCMCPDAPLMDDHPSRTSVPLNGQTHVYMPKRRQQGRLAARHPETTGCSQPFAVVPMHSSATGLKGGLVKEIIALAGEVVGTDANSAPADNAKHTALVGYKP